MPERFFPASHLKSGPNAKLTELFSMLAHANLGCLGEIAVARLDVTNGRNGSAAPVRDPRLWPFRVDTAGHVEFAAINGSFLSRPLAR
jgi:hypothetical protein